MAARYTISAGSLKNEVCTTVAGELQLDEAIDLISTQ